MKYTLPSLHVAPSVVAIKTPILHHYHYYVQDNFVPTLIDAVYAFANALHNYIEENCNFTSGWNWANQSCPGQISELNHLSLLHYLGKVDFISPLTEGRVKFDSLGNIKCCRNI